ncbi:hypothetical protein [[Eubacterium] cellulosolvens]
MLIVGVLTTPTVSQPQINQKTQLYQGMTGYNVITLTNTTLFTTSYSSTVSLVETSADPGGYKFFVWSGYFDFEDGDIIDFQTNGLIKVTGPQGETLYQGGETVLHIKESGTYRIYITVGHGLVLYIRIYRVTIISSTSTIVAEYVQTMTSNQTQTNSTLTTSAIHNSTSDTQTTSTTTTSIDAAVPGFLPISILLGVIIGLAVIGLSRRSQPLSVSALKQKEGRGAACTDVEDPSSAFSYLIKYRRPS